MWPQPLCPIGHSCPRPLKQAPLGTQDTSCTRPAFMEPEMSAPPITTFTGDQGPSDLALATSFRPNTLRIQLFPQFRFSKAPRLIGPQPLVQSDNHSCLIPWDFYGGVGVWGPSPSVSGPHRTHHFPHSRLPLCRPYCSPCPRRLGCPASTPALVPAAAQRCLLSIPW